MKTKRSAALCLGALLLMGLATLDCSESQDREPGTGVLELQLTDAPLDVSTIGAVFVVIEGITVFPADDSNGGLVPTPISDTFPRTFNLLELTDDRHALLALVTLPAGLYSHMFVHLQSAWIDFDGDPNTDDIEPLTLVGGNKYNVILPFEIVAGGMVQKVIDFELRDPSTGEVRINCTGDLTDCTLIPVLLPGK
ncbi:MAG: DUF4382 domain-containing protein [Acidobacteria bacterium]|nr:DUF4382 domain-containing protein [Acidobacteriota bacterium]